MSFPQQDLTCEEMVELVTGYIEDTLPPAERTRFEVHLGKCQGCTNYLDQMRKTILLVGKLSEDTIEPEARDTFLTIFRTWKTGDDA